MREIVSISLDARLKRKIEQAAKRHRLPKSTIIKGALEKYLAVLDFEKLRSELMPYGKKSGYLIDSDIYNDPAFS